jgi:sugar-specific transcriptional regulator TrmB
LNNEILIERLKSLGFKEYESKVLIVLLSGNPMSASEIAKEAKIIRNSIYDILKAFVEKGYCNEIETNTILNYQIIDPAVIFDKITSDYRKSFKHRMDSLAETFGELQNIYKAESAKIEGPDKDIQLIRGFNKHRVAKINELVLSSKIEILGMFSPRRAIDDTVSEDAKKFIKSGGVIRSIYQLGDDDQSNGDLIKACELFEKGGEQLRLSEFRLTNTFIFDKETVFINLSSDRSVPKHKQADIIIKNADYAVHMRDLFEHYWSLSLKLEDYKKKR